MMQWWKISLVPLMALGERSLAACRYLAILAAFVYLPIRRTLLPPYSGMASIRRTTVMQIYFTGVQIMPLFAFLCLVFGLSLAMTMQTAVTIKALLCTIVLKGVAPILMALIILGRSGTAVTVELGNMSVLGEIKQLRRMGVDPFRHLLFPRLIGVTTATFFMGVFFRVGIVVFTGLFSSEPFTEFIEEVLNHWSVYDAILVTEKEIIFGMIISMVACYQGLNLKPLTTEVPKATIRTVIHCIILCVIVNFLFSLLMLGIF
jgi:phospholipid/cholesterol/gamma-HCH transport system permease protein